MAKIPSYLLNLAGEYRVCSELNMRAMFATVTYGNRKGVDVYAISDRQERALKIEVKTTQGKTFITAITQKDLEADPMAPDFWVLFQLRAGTDETFGERFFVLTHQEICDVQKRRNQRYAEGYVTRHGRQPDFSRGVDNVTVDDVKEHEGKWAKINLRFERGSDA
jgi:hypothetical protein